MPAVFGRASGDSVNVGDKVLVTTDGWFYGTNGRSYRGVWGTVTEIQNDQESLGIKTNAKSANWYLVVGGMLIAGCQVHYVCKCDTAPPETVSEFTVEQGVVINYERPSHIFNADA